MKLAKLWNLFCFQLNINVIKSSNKLFKYFIKTYRPNSIISYSDNSWINDKENNLYIDLGFKYIGETKPNYWYVITNLYMRNNKFNYRKDILIKEGYDKDKTEHEIMLERGIYRIYDCGNYKFSWNK